MLFNRFGNSEPVAENMELTPEEESVIIESVLLDGLSKEELDSFLENSAEVNNAINLDILQERSVVRLDKMAKLDRAIATSTFVVARRKKDRDMKKLDMLWKLEAVLRKRIEKRHGAEGRRLAKKAMRNGNKAQSKIVKRTIDNTKKEVSTALTKPAK